MPSIAVLILNWNGKKFLADFLPTLIQHTPNDLADIIVADNHSSDDSLVYLETAFPMVQTIVLNKNYGFAEGYNQAISQCKHEYILLINSDVAVTPDWLSPLLERLQQDKVMAVMPKIKAHYAETHFEYAGAAGGFLDKFGYPFCRGRIFDSVEVDDGQYNDAMRVFWTTGACMLVQRTVFEELGGFDKYFFAHMEEIDWCWRANNQGGELWMEPASTVYHVGGGTLPKESPFKAYLNFRNNLALLHKNLPREKVFPTILARLLLDGVAGFQFLLKGKLRMLGAIFKAHWTYFSWIPRLNRYRRSATNKPKRLASIYPRSIVVDYFIRKKKKFSSLNYK